MNNQRVVVVGMGASGIAAARLCRKRGAHVIGVDRKSAAELGPNARAFVAEGGLLAGEDVRDALLAEADLIVVSPGVPSVAALEEAAARGTPVWSEVELACRELAAKSPSSNVKPPVVAVGGTNGKSTTTTLVGELLQTAFPQVFLGGNLGEPLSSHVDEPWDAVVLEVSSFQLERLDAFKPKVSILLNVTPDHLDRYPSFDAYAAAKGNAFVRQDPSDLAVVPAGDALCLREAQRGRAAIVSFGPGGDIDVTDDAVIDRARGVRFERSAIALRGAHNALNVAAAWAAARELGVDPDAAQRVFSTFHGLAHRMALVGEVDGVRFYDDSKGTNVGASVTALLGLAEPRAVLIAGGVDKGGSYEPLVRALESRSRGVVLIGEAAPLIERAIDGRVPVKRASSMDEAVRVAQGMASAGDAVLLSPACSSFDMFRDYKERGDVFVAAVKKLVPSA